MQKYLLIDSQGELDASGPAHFLDLAKTFHANGEQVEILLVQNGVLSARAGAKAPAVSAAIAAGVPVLADDFALRERSLPPSALVKGVSPASIGVVVKRLAEGWKVIWC